MPFPQGTARHESERSALLPERDRTESFLCSPARRHYSSRRRSFRTESCCRCKPSIYCRCPPARPPWCRWNLFPFWRSESSSHAPGTTFRLRVEHASYGGRSNDHENCHQHPIGTRLLLFLCCLKHCSLLYIKRASAASGMRAIGFFDKEGLRGNGKKGREAPR